MKYNGKNNPRVIIIQKIYSKLINNDLDLNFPNIDIKNLLKMLLTEHLREMKLSITRSIYILRMI